MKSVYTIEFKSIGKDTIGYLTSLEENKNIPFNIKRVYYTYQVPEDTKRGFHTHKNLEQVLICVNGSLKVKCFDGKEEQTYTLDSPNKGLYIGNMVWREIYEYKENTVLMVLASEHYNESDYIRNYDEFLNLYKETNQTLADKINLIEYDEECLNLSWKWLNDQEIKYLTGTSNITKEKQLEWFSSLKDRTDYIIYGVLYNNEKIGAVGLKNINGNKAEYWGYIGEKKYWGKKIGNKMINNIILIAKEKKINEIYLRVSEKNKRAINLYRKNGFKDKEVKNKEIIMNKII